MLAASQCRVSRRGWKTCSRSSELPSCRGRGGIGVFEPKFCGETDSDAVESSCSENDLLSMVWSWLDGRVKLVRLTSRVSGRFFECDHWPWIAVTGEPIRCFRFIRRRRSVGWPKNWPRLVWAKASGSVSGNGVFRVARPPRIRVGNNGRSAAGSRTLWCWRVGQCFERLR